MSIIQKETESTKEIRLSTYVFHVCYEKINLVTKEDVVKHLKGFAEKKNRKYYILVGETENRVECLLIFYKDGSRLEIKSLDNFCLKIPNSPITITPTVDKLNISDLFFEAEIIRKADPEPFVVGDLLKFSQL